MIQVNLKLKFTKVTKVIKVKYNTYEKATFDQYLIASLALREKNAEECYKYIDNITGNGSLNEHFKRLYGNISKMSDEDLQKVMDNSMMPVLKIDESNWYDYYSDLDQSVYKGHIYQGDMGDYDNILDIIMLKEDVVDKKVDVKKTTSNPEPYIVTFADDNTISLKMHNNDVKISDDVFETFVENDLDNITKYGGAILQSASGGGWSILTNSVLNNLFSTNKYFYQDGSHYLVKSDNLRKTQVASLHGLYIYNESIVQYVDDQELCIKALNLLQKIHSCDLLKPYILRNILQVLDEKTSVDYVNDYIASKGKLPLEIEEYCFGIIRENAKAKFTRVALDYLLARADNSDYTYLYKCNNKLRFNINQLVQIDNAVLTKEDAQKVQEHYKNIEDMKQSIKVIIGEVTTSGLRENAKKLKSDNTTKKFSKLCNELIGHESKNIDEATLEELQSWHKKAIELKSLGDDISKRLATEL